MRSTLSIKTSIILGLAALLLAGAVLWYVLLPQTPEIRHVLLISIDTCRSDHLGCYGYPLDTTPNIDAIAKQGIVFENAVSPVPYTLPAHCSMLTGTIPPFHGVLDNSDYRLSKENTTLAELLKEKGFSTAAFVSSFVLDARFGMGQGFDLYDDEFAETSAAMGINQCSADESTRDAVAWLDKHRHEKGFVFLHYYDPHFTYDPPEPFASKFKEVPQPDNVTTPFGQALFDGYAGEIAYTDHCIGQVMGRLKQLGLYDSTLIIITSDHGEMLGQHGEGFHGYYVYQPAIEVPLIFKLPGKSTAQRIANTVGLVDIVPTVCAMLGIELPAPIQGQDLSPCFNGRPLPSAERHLFCQSLEPSKYNANSLLGVVTDEYKYIHTTRPELYDLLNDPNELSNIAGEQPDRLQAMDTALSQILAEATQPQANSRAGLDEETRQRLESLGYVSGALNEELDVSKDAEDPKDLIKYHVRTMQIGFLIYQEQYELAERECRALIAQRPSFYRPYFNLAKMAMKQDKSSEAIAHLEKVIEFKPDHVDAYKGLAEAYKAQGQLNQAVTAYAKVLELQADYAEAYYKLALCCYELGNFRAPEAYATGALLDDPLYVDAAIDLAEKLLKKQQIRLAYEHYLRILEPETDSVTVLNALAWIQATCAITGLANPEQAVLRALRACELTDNAKAEVLDTLAAAYAAAGRFVEAKDTAQKAIRIAQAAENSALARRITNRLSFYKAERPYRDAALAHDAGQ
jgi:choline-sulfatase